jgi:hypothetical protein
MSPKDKRSIGADFYTSTYIEVLGVTEVYADARAIKYFSLHQFRQIVSLLQRYGRLTQPLAQTGQRFRDAGPDDMQSLDLKNYTIINLFWWPIEFRR